MLDGFVNCDLFVNSDKVVNIFEVPLPWDDNSVDFIIAEHVEEHGTPPDGLRFMMECLRILKPGGVLRLCVPVVGVHLKREHARDLIINHGHLQALDRNIVITMLWAAGFDLSNIKITGRSDLEGHWKVIGKPLDDEETLRINAQKS